MTLTIDTDSRTLVIDDGGLVRTLDLYVDLPALRR